MYWTDYKERQPDNSNIRIKIGGRSINNLKYADDTSLLVESKKELKIGLMKVKEETWMAGLKVYLKKTIVMTTEAITSWYTEELEVVRMILSSNVLKGSVDVSLVAKVYKDTCLSEGRLWLIWTAYLKAIHHFINKYLYIQGYDFSSSNIWLVCIRLN